MMAEGGGASAWTVPDTVGEEEVRRLDGRQLRQEGGGHGDGDVAGGRHAALVVHVPAGARRGGLKTCAVVFRRRNVVVFFGDAASPEHLVSDDGILARDDVVDVGGEPLQEAGTCRTKRRFRGTCTCTCTNTNKA